MTRRIEARSLHVLVSSDHSLANKQMAEAVARVLSRYAIDFTPGVEINVPHDGDEVTYMASAPKSFFSYQRAARTASRRKKREKDYDRPASSSYRKEGDREPRHLAVD